MGIYIKSMRVPKSCGECLGIGWHYVFECNIDDVEEGEKLSTCPLFSIPPHGKLIDVDELRNIMFIGEQCLYSWDEIDDAIDYAHTVIQADDNKN